MNKYSRGKIYKIVDNTNGDVYYGSTTETLKERLRKHTSNSNECNSKLIINNGDYNIILVEYYPCNSVEELESREAHYIINNQCINVKIPGRTNKEWYEDNREKISEKRKKHYQDNKDKKKKYYDDNKDRQRKIYQYKISWGGNSTHNNNLLKIDVNLFF